MCFCGTEGIGNTLNEIFKHFGDSCMLLLKALSICSESGCDIDEGEVGSSYLLNAFCAD